MSKRNPEYDFKWCPGCGDFGVRRAIERALTNYGIQHEIAYAQNVVIAGIGCSGNMVHLLEGEQPFGLHGVHGRTLPLALGVKMANPELNTVVVAGDGDFLSIGAEHIAPAAQRNLDVTCVIMDNGIYGLTKGQSSPTSQTGQVTSSTPAGKLETALDPLNFYMSVGVTYIASHYSSKPKELAKIIEGAMNHEGFAIVHVQSPCTTYNDTYELLKGNNEKGIAPLIWEVPENHDPGDAVAAKALISRKGLPVGVIYASEQPTLGTLYRSKNQKRRRKSLTELFDTYLLQ